MLVMGAILLTIVVPTGRVDPRPIDGHTAKDAEAVAFTTAILVPIDGIIGIVGGLLGAILRGSDWFQRMRSSGRSRLEPRRMTAKSLS